MEKETAVIEVHYDAEEGKEPRPSDRVAIRELPVKHYDAAGAIFHDEPQFVELVTRKPKGWAVTLTPASYEAVATACKEVNARFFASLARRVATVRAVAPEVVSRSA